MEKMLLNIFVLIQQVLFRSIVQSDRHGNRSISQNSISSASAKAAASVVAPIAAIAAAWANKDGNFSRVAAMSSFGVRGMSQPLGIKICCCRVLTCINFGFVVSGAGLIKGLQLGLAMLCEGLLIRYGLPYADSIGQALTSFLATTGHCFTTTSILLICYCFSERSYGLIRQSLFETLFNVMASCMYFTSSSYMGFACVVWLHPQFLVRPGFWAYPAMTAAYYIGYAAGLVHAIDAYLSFRHYRGQR